jgi:transglutaminase-like putative cysteine protease
LPIRKASTESAPALPPRRPSGFSRKESRESLASDVSYSTSTSAGRTTTASTTSVDSGSTRSVRAPAWGETKLPPLPPKRSETKTVTRPKPSPANSSRSLSRGRPTLPPRRESIHSTSTDRVRSVSRPPPLPSRSNRDKSPLPNGDINGKQPTRRLPPPLPSNATLEKIQSSGFAGINRNAETSGQCTNGIGREPKSNSVPPPVPLSTRPDLDLSKLQVTKPRVNNPTPSATASSTICLKCRDFSAPDAHAARYPRENLPSYDMGWLARELTAPFPSPTDKARVLFTWFHHNIEYDVHSFFNNCVKPSTPASTLASGLAVCEGYAGLFAALATHAGLEAVVVSGHGKGYGYDAPAPGSPLPPVSATGHAWSAVRIDNGQWKLLDACWGAGAVQGPGRPYQKQFNPAMFTDSNDEFGLRHFPSNRSHFYRDDGRPEISWQEYILGSPDSPLSAEQPTIFGDAKKHSLGERSFRPAAKQISVHQPGPLRFQFNLICEHWTLQNHTRAKPGLFLLMVHGIDGRQEDRIPFTHVQGSGPGGGGDCWYVDVPDAKVLGAPGQKLAIAVLTSFGDRNDARGVTAEEYRQQVGRVGMAWAYIAEWQLV